MTAKGKYSTYTPLNWFQNWSIGVFKWSLHIKILHDQFRKHRDDGHMHIN